MGLRYNPVEASVPFIKVIEIPVTAATNAGVIALQIPVYNVVWADFNLTCSNNNIVYTFSVDSSAGGIIDLEVTSTPGAKRVQRIINGTPVNVSTTYGPHIFTLTARNYTLNQTAGVHGTVTLYGRRRG